jgi:Uma2 family endonuclease
MEAPKGLAGRGTRRITGSEYSSLEDAAPSELVRGKVVPLKQAHFDHGNVEWKFARALGTFAEANDLGKIAVGEVGVYTQRAPDTVRAADVVFVSNERLARRSAGFLDVAPDLVVEVHGSNESWRRLRRKVGEYFACGVRLVWVVEPRKRRVLVHRSATDVRELRQDDELSGEDVLPGFKARVGDLL